MMLKSISTAAAFFGTLFLSFNIQAQTSLTGIVAFGDSLTDNGNLFQMEEGKSILPPYYYGRFSNGILWSEVLTAQLGFAPNHLDNYAIAGAQTHDAQRTPAGLTSQVTTYVEHNPQVDTSKLYILWAGGNDYIFNPAAKSAMVDDAVANVKSSIVNLANHGANNFLIPNLPNIGDIPLSDTKEYKFFKSNLVSLSREHNQKLAAMLTSLQQERPDLHIVSVDIYQMMEDRMTTPKKYGFRNVTTACYNGPKEGYTDPSCQDSTICKPCAFPDTYLFWDAVHPTAAAHRQLASLAVEALKQAGLVL